MIRIHLDRSGRVDAQSVMHLPMSAGAVWGQMRDLPRFLTRDPLHREVEVEEPDAQSAGVPARLPWRPGVRLRIRHEFLGLRVWRVGRVLQWREGVGFAVSDLSSRGVHRGFPHVCLYQVEPVSESTCRLTVSARGRWTATWMPRWLVRLWLRWVLAATEGRLAVELSAVRRIRRRALRQRPNQANARCAIASVFPYPCTHERQEVCRA